MNALQPHTRHIAATAAAALLAASLVPALALGQSEPTPSPHDPEATVERAVRRCKDQWAGKKPIPGPFTVSTICELRAWATLGRHYPDLADRALKAEAKLNAARGKIGEVRRQLKRERNHADALARKIGRLEADLGRTHPRWVTYVSIAGSLLAGVALGFGIAAAR